MGAKMKLVDGVLLPLGTGTAAAVMANQLPQNQRSTKKVLEAKEKKEVGRFKKAAPVFSKSAGFNEKAAQEAFDLVMKMDTETARVFTEIVVGEVVEEIIEKNQRTLQGHLNRVIAKREEMIKKALVRTAIHKADDTLPYAQALSEITKANGKPHPNPYDLGYRFQESDFNRDPASGQFRAKVKHTMTKPVSERQAPAVIGTENPKHLKGQDLARYQDEYRQVAGFLDAVNHSLGKGNANTVLHLRDRKTGERWAEPIYSMKASQRTLEDPNIEIQGIEARPNTLTAGGAAFGLSTALGSTPSSSRTKAVSGAAGGFDDFATSWMNTEDNDRYNSNAQTYRRLAAGSKYVSQIAPAGSKLQMAAAFGQFAGDMGPQAEMVIGPAARKTAYRYRGTEKTPDSDMVRNYEVAIKRSKQNAVAEQFSGPRRRVQTGGQVHQRAAEIAAERRPPTWEERDPGRAVIIGHLMSKLPSQELSSLQLASGNTPPSQGVMLNKDGQIVTEAVGYADDHYLPFDLKNLKNLKGGEYIRTRSYGGLTAEDIYTGLASGARQVTVVSHSGVFTVEFEGDFRGGRRYNDKARRMTHRYEQILDAVQSGQVDRQPVSPLVRAKIVENVRADFPGESPATIQNAIKSRIEAYKASPELQPEDEELILELAARRAAAEGNTRDARDYVDQITSDVMRSKAMRFQLDGVGYEAAQNALTEQFPYYIKARAEVRTTKDTINPMVDRGYVEPGRNRPTEARAGLFGTSVNPGRKFSASHADYQEHAARRAGGTANGVERPEPKGEETGEKVPAPKEVVRGIIAERKYANAAGELHKVFNDPGVLDPASKIGVLSVLNLPVDQFSDPLRANELSAAVNELERHRDQLRNDGQHEALRVLDNYKLAVNLPKEYTPELGLHWTPAPFPFPEKAYQPGAPLEEQQAEIRKINGRTQSVLYGGNLSSLSENQMREEVKALADVHRIVGQHPELQSRDEAGAEERKRMARELFGNYNERSIGLLLEKPNKIQKRIEDLQRMRTLMTPFWSQGMNLENFTARVPEPKEVRVPPPMLQPSTPESQRQRRALKESFINEHMERLREGMRQAGIGNTAEHEAAINQGHAMLGDLDAIDDTEIGNWSADTRHLTAERRAH